jgi:hypothetical protein
MLTFAHLLRTVDLKPSEVRLLRHQDTRYPGWPGPYVLWRDHPERFDAYQGTQAFENAAKLRAPVWASFVGLPGKDTLFVGLYAARLVGPLPQDRAHPVDGSPEAAGSCNLYDLAPMEALSVYSGRLLIDWGAGYRSWIQRADGGPKPVVELRRAFQEDAFPGFTRLILRLSEIDAIPRGWQDALAATGGVYLLTCPRTSEQYVGSASGTGGFLARWKEYEVTGHGGNVALKSRDASDYQVSIVETVGSAASTAEVLALEALWKDKLQSRVAGLNRN